MEYVYAGSLIKTIYLIFNHLIYWACFSLEWKECQTLFIALIWYKLCISAAISKSQNRSSFFFAKNCVFLVYSAAIFLNINPSFWIPWGPKYTYNLARTHSNRNFSPFCLNIGLGSSGSHTHRFKRVFLTQSLGNQTGNSQSKIFQFRSNF